MKFVIAVVSFLVGLSAFAGELSRASGVGTVHEFSQSKPIGFIKNDSEILLRNSNYDLQSISLKDFSVKSSFKLYGDVSSFDPNGEFMIQAPNFDEALVTHTIDLNQIHRTRSRLPLLRDERPHLIQRELARILADNAG